MKPDLSQALTAEGRRQIAATAIKLRKEPDYDAIFSSQYVRALETAAALQEELSIPAGVQRSSLLRERDYGTHHAHEKAVVPGYAYSPFAYAGFSTLSDAERWRWKPYEDFESDYALLQRYIRFTRQMARLPYGRVLAATHSGFMRVALMHHKYIGYEDWDSYAIENGAAYEVVYTSRGETISRVA